MFLVIIDIDLYPTSLFNLILLLFRVYCFKCFTCSQLYFMYVSIKRCRKYCNCMPNIVYLFAVMVYRILYISLL